MRESHPGSRGRAHRRNDTGAVVPTRGGAPQAAGGHHTPLWDTPQPYVLRVCVSLPDHRLTLNRVGSRQSGAMRARLVAEAKREAIFATFNDSMPDVPRPIFPAGVALFMAFDVERRKRGQRWDTSGLIEAMKSYQDAWNGILYADDRQIVGYGITWDERPTGRGIVTVTIREVDRSLAMYFGKG